MKKFIKLYRVKPDAFERNAHGKWQLKPDARLYGYFGVNYNRDDQKHPYDVAPDTVSSFDTYNNLLSQHRGRRYNATIYNADGTIDVNNVSPKWRGYSALAYSKQDRDNYFSGWRTPTKYAPGKKPVYNNMGKFERLEAPHLVKILGSTPPNIEETWRNPRDDVKDSVREEFPFSTDPVNYIYDGMAINNDRDYDISTGTQQFYTVPFIVYADEDDVVSLDDVLNHDYEPFRDYFDEVHLKRIRDKMQPIGLYTLNSTSMLDTRLRDIKSAQAALKSAYNSIIDSAGNLNISSDNSTNTRSILKHSFNRLYVMTNSVDDSVTVMLDEYPKLQDMLAQIVKNYESSFSELKSSLSFIIGHIDYFMKYLFGTGSNSMNAIHYVNETMQLIRNFNLAVNRLIAAAHKFMHSSEYKDDSTSYTDMDIDKNVLRKFIQENFNFDDPDTYSDAIMKNIVPVDIGTLSDEQYKTILFDILDDINKRRSHSNICEACLGIGR